MRKNARQRADHNRGRIDHQRAVVAVCIFDQITDGFTATATGHVFVRCGADQARLGQRLACAASSAIPTAAGTAGDQEVDVFQNLVSFGECRGTKTQGRNCGDHCAPSYFECHDLSSHLTTVRNAAQLDV